MACCTPPAPKHDYAWHTEAMDRAMQGGIDDVGLGALLAWIHIAREFTSLLMHAEHLESAMGVGAAHNKHAQGKAGFGHQSR